MATVGIELRRAARQVEGYQSRPFGRGVGSQFHHGHGSGGPPIIPDSRISQVRFETLAGPLQVFPSPAKLKRWFAYISTFVVGRSLVPAQRQRDCRFYQAGHPAGTGTTKCPEPLCPTLALPPLGRCVPISSEGVTPPSSLVRTHASNPSGSPLLRL